MRRGLRLRYRGDPLAFFDFSADPGGAGSYTLPAWLDIACATTGRTSQMSAATLKTGFGANAARARSVDGVGWGLSVESARTLIGKDLASWGTSGTVTVDDATDPSGATSACAVNDADAGATGFLVDSFAFPTATMTGSAWEQVITAPVVGVSRLNWDWDVPTLIDRTTVDATWVRRDVTGTVTVGAHVCVIEPLTTAAETGITRVYSFQAETGSYPSSAYVLPGDVADSRVRAADVLSLSSPESLLLGGRFDITLIYVPNFADTEQAADNNIVYANANNRLYLQQSTKKLVLRIGGVNLLSSALTWSRNQALTIRIAHKTAYRLLDVSGATTGDGTSYDTAMSAITLPATVYLLGSNTGAEECADLRFISFARP